MDFQDMGILSVLAIFVVTFIVVMVNRSKGSNSKPQIEMKED